MTDTKTVLYRLVEHDPPTLDDMRSYHELGIPLRVRTAETVRQASGISLYNTEQQARNQAGRLQRPEHRFIAELQIPANAPVTIERTGRRGHYTLWESPDVILGFVTRVVPIGSEEEEETP